MTKNEWESLQKEYGVKMLDANYQNMSIEFGRFFLKIVVKELNQHEGDDYNDSESEPYCLLRKN